MSPANALSRKDTVDTSDDNSAGFIINILVALDAETVLLPRSQKDNWYFDQDALYYRSCLYICEPTHHSLMKNIHEFLAGTHSSYFYTISLLQKDYWWPGMTTFICKFIAGCATCQANKVNMHPTHPPFASISSKCSCPFQQISMDLITDLSVPWL